MAQHKLQHLPSSPCPMNKQLSFGESSTSSDTARDELSGSSSSDDEFRKKRHNMNLKNRNNKNKRIMNLPILPDLKAKTHTENSSKSSPSNDNTTNNYAYLIICSLGICICYLSCGFINERLYSMHSVKQAGPISSFVVMTQTFTNFIVAFIGKTYDDNNNRASCTNSNASHGGVLNHKLFFISSFCYFVAMTVTNESLNYVSYPTATLVKSSKIIPNMIMGYLIEHKSYSTIEYVGTAFITIGIIGFNLSRMDASKNSNAKPDSSYGLLLLFLSLTMDGVLGSFQNMLKKESSSSSDKKKIHYRKPTAMETMLCMNFYAFIFLLPTSCIFTSHLKNGVTLLFNNHATSFPSLLLYLNGSAALGQIFIFITITKFSPLVCTIVTTTRKFITILLSVLYFGHRFSFTQWFFTIMIFTGIYVEIFCCDHIVIVSSDKKKKIL